MSKYAAVFHDSDRYVFWWFYGRQCLRTVYVRYGHLSYLNMLFGFGKGSGAALMMFILGVSGSLICIIMGRKLKRYQYREDML